MHYIDLLVSFILFVVGVLALCLKRFRIRIWIVLLSLIFFPVSVVTYYFPEIDPVFFDDVSILTIVVYPLVKILILVAIIQYISKNRRRAGAR